MYVIMALKHFWFFFEKVFSFSHKQIFLFIIMTIMLKMGMNGWMNCDGDVDDDGDDYGNAFI